MNDDAYVIVPAVNGDQWYTWEVMERESGYAVCATKLYRHAEIIRQLVMQEYAEMMVRKDDTRAPARSVCPKTPWEERAPTVFPGQSSPYARVEVAESDCVYRLGVPGGRQ